MEQQTINVIADRDAWCREKLNAERVDLFAEMYREEGTDALPPIIVTPADKNGNCYLVDGWHRYHAAQKAGVPLNVQFHKMPEGIDSADPEAAKWEAYLEGLELSARSALPMTTTEKRAAVDRLIAEADMTDTDIARLVGVTRKTVYNRRQVEVSAEPGTDTTNGVTLEKEAARLVSLLSAMHEQRGFVTGLSTGATRRKMAVALAGAAGQRFGDQAPQWLARFGEWAGEAAQIAGQQQAATGA